MKRRRRKCQRCGRQLDELREVSTAAGWRLLCVLCRTERLPFKPTSAARR